jgi:hypothetical protein
MSIGIEFQQFVSELKAAGFPVDKVSGGDIQSAFLRRLNIREAIYELHGVAERRRKQQENKYSKVKLD